MNPRYSDRHSRFHEQSGKSGENCEQDEIVRLSREKVSLNKEMNNQVRGSGCTNNIDRVHTQTNELKQDTDLSQEDNSFKGKIHVLILK